MSIRRLALGALVVAPLLASLGCATSRAPIQVAAGRALFWEVQGGEGGATLYLLGSVHVGDGRPLVLDAKLERAFARSEELLVELDLEEVTPARVFQLLERHAMLAPGEELSQRIAPETETLLVAWTAKRGLERAVLERFEPWAISLVVLQSELEAAGYEGAYGVDQWFMSRAGQDGKPIVGLETLEEQVELMSNLRPEHQERLLRETLLALGQPADGAVPQVQALIEAWERGDAETLERLAFDGLGEDPSFASFFDAVYFARNEAMSRALVRFMADGRTRFCVVGSGHLVGERGIPALLAREGWRVTGPGLPSAGASR